MRLLTERPQRAVFVALLSLTLMGIAVSVSCADAPSAYQTYTVHSDFQDGDQVIVVLTPDSYDPSKKYRVLYLLPALNDSEGKSLKFPFQQANIQNRYDLILVTMSFANMPWYGDHPTNPKIRQESYLRNFVVPFVEGKYSTFGTAEGRLLMGYSKSGWAAFSLILRNPEFFGYAAAWDSPYLMNRLDFGSGDVFATLDQLALYRPDLLVSKQKDHFQGRPRLELGGEFFFGVQKSSGKDQMIAMHELLDANGIKHLFFPDLNVQHCWDIEWIDPMVKGLVDMASGAALTEK